jgi:hypothetical protein
MEPAVPEEEEEELLKDIEETVLTPAKELNRKRWHDWRHQELLELRQFEALESQIVQNMTLGGAQPLELELEEEQDEPRDLQEHARDENDALREELTPVNLQSTIKQNDRSLQEDPDSNQRNQLEEPEEQEEEQEHAHFEDSTFVSPLSNLSFSDSNLMQNATMKSCRCQKMSLIFNGQSRSTLYLQVQINPRVWRNRWLKMQCIQRFMRVILYFSRKIYKTNWFIMTRNLFRTNYTQDGTTCRF